ncbi:MAG: hypothetical protein GX130_10050 [Candidatus Hydrogenedens sp.]|jgi:hypothetical protein|nr:hypothetical protein [Candidatus Hydrogenedens sp.]
MNPIDLILEKRIGTRPVLLLSLAAAFLFFVSIAVPTAQALEAGAAKVEITPPVGTPLNGYGDRMGRPSTAVHDPLWARTVFLDDGSTRFFLISLDLVAVNPELRERVLELYSGAVPKENVLMVATHTHNGHGGMCRNLLLRSVSGRFIPEVLEATAEKIVESMKKAYSNRTRAALGYGLGNSEGLSVNRRFANGPAETQFGVIRIEDADGKPIALITNFTGHPTSMGGEDKYSFSADYPGYYYLEIESLAGEECVALFLNGAQGNQTISGPSVKSDMSRTEGVGREIAQKAHALSKDLAFSDVIFKLSHKKALLPLTLADNLQPESADLYSLEINDLLISFFPGEPCVEIGLNLRERALDRGYEAHWSVGLANDYLMYFVPRSLYPYPEYESFMNFFGPGMEDWLYREFESLMSRKMLVESIDSLDDEVVEDMIPHEPQESQSVFTVRGSAHEMGLARGNFFQDSIQKKYKERIFDPVDTGKWYAPGSWWKGAPSFMNLTPVALTSLGMGSRSLLLGLSEDYIREMEGLAEGAGLPFDGLWLMQHARLYTLVKDQAELFSLPLCTMVALTGDYTGTGDLLLGRTLDWVDEEEDLILRTLPESGIPSLQVGFDWTAGVLTGLNQERLFLSLEYVPYGEDVMPPEAPVEFLLGELLRRCSSYSEAVERLTSADYIRNYHVLVAGYDGEKSSAAVVEYGDKITVRHAEEGILLGVLPETEGIPEETRTRYQFLYEKLKETPVTDREELGVLLTPPLPDEGGNMNRLWNDYSRHCVVLHLSEAELSCAMREANGEAGTFITQPVREEVHHD